MKISASLVALTSLFVAACGSSSDSNPARAADADSGTASSADVFAPPPPKEGFTRIAAPVIENIGPGDDVAYCQYIAAPLDHDIDILAVGGYQSKYGHHAVAYATSAPKAVGTSGPCAADETMSGGFLGGIGGEGTTGVTLPDNVAFRLPKGSGILLNAHFVNTGGNVVEGRVVLDVKFADVDPSRRIAALLTNANVSFSVPAKAPGEAVAECKLPRDLDFIIYGNHMHDRGTSAVTDLLRGDGTTESVHDDPQWTRDKQFNAPLTQWTIDAPLHVAAGDTLRTHCTWENPTDQPLAFPGEMCIGFGFFLSDGSTNPVCVDGSWLE